MRAPGPRHQPQRGRGQRICQRGQGDARHANIIGPRRAIVCRALAQTLSSSWGRSVSSLRPVAIGPGQALRCRRMADDNGSGESHNGSRAAAGPIEVIIADDHTVVRDGIPSVLERVPEEFRVVAETADVPSTVRAVREHKPDLLTLDLSMPSGYRNPQIAERLQVAERTVKTYRARAIEKRGFSSRAEITAYVRRTGLAD